MAWKFLSMCTIFEPINPHTLVNAISTIDYSAEDLGLHCFQQSRAHIRGKLE